MQCPPSPPSTERVRNVLLLAESPYFGGITSHILSLLEAFARVPQFRLVVATLPGRRNDTTLIDAARALGHRVYTVPMGWRFDLGVVKSLRTLARDERIDLVHTHNYRSTLLAALALHSIPRMNTSHGQVVEASRRLRAWQALEVAVVARNRLTVACSEYVRQWLISKGVPERKVRTIHNCATAPGTEANIVPLRASVSDLVAVYCGRLAEGKGVETFIRAVAQTPNVYGLLVGDGPARGDLETLAGELHARVEFVGFATDPRPYYAASDVVVLPSRMEALPMVLIEAMAQGKPVIATNVGGIPEIIADGETGILIEYGDVRALGEALTRLKSAALRQTMGVNGLRRWRDDFTPERMALALAQAYSDALGGE